MVTRIMVLPVTSLSQPSGAGARDKHRIGQVPMTVEDIRSDTSKLREMREWNGYRGDAE